MAVAAGGRPDLVIRELTRADQAALKFIFGRSEPIRATNGF
jgi:hypothetical protein